MLLLIQANNSYLKRLWLNLAMRQIIRAIYTLSRPAHLRELERRIRAIMTSHLAAIVSRIVLHLFIPSVSAARDTFIAGTRPGVTDRAKLVTRLESAERDASESTGVVSDRFSPPPGARDPSSPSSFLAVSRISGKLCWKAAGGGGGGWGWGWGFSDYIRGR